MSIPANTSLLGKAKELQVASELVAAGAFVFFPLVDTGFDLIATNRKGTVFLPVQVKYRAKEPALGLNPADVANFEGTNVVVAWVIGTESKTRSWYLPFPIWRERAVAPDTRKDGLAYITIGENQDWLSQYEGRAGIRNTFRTLLPSGA